MKVKSSCNCCINFWDESEESFFDVYVIFPEYMGNDPLEDGTLETIEHAYKESLKIDNCADVRSYIKEVLDEKGIEYVAILCRKL